eukprot:2653282-Pleurochrysis_carterae.AAC.2
MVSSVTISFLPSRLFSLVDHRAKMKLHETFSKSKPIDPLLQKLIRSLLSMLARALNMQNSSPVSIIRTLETSAPVKLLRVQQASSQVWAVEEGSGQERFCCKRQEELEQARRACRQKKGGDIHRREAQGGEAENRT